MNKNNLDTHRISKNQAILLGSFLIILFFTVLGGWLVITAKTIRVFDIKLTHLVLKNDGCNFLKMNGIDTKTAEFGNGCSVVLPFLKNLYGNGGVITLDDKQIKISDDLVVAIGAAENQSWTPAETQALIVMIISTIVLGLTVWMFIFILKKADNQ
jgi:hypothetical protein